ncbi:MAG: hypothetical protein CVV44_01810 [Spirochaetae bacterium HGW-Spirochaetae-1]|jgi:hypothetical protein|nr:MAG: hypothetical protein CVV44_01810 [Spirochaetae bacterium HGW-Spirochaetae-1]
MDIGIIDVGEWQKVVDFRSGRTATVPDRRTADVAAVKEIMSAHPYPGDCETESVDWAFATAQSLIGIFDPRCVIITVGTLYFTEMSRSPGEYDRRQLLDGILQSLEKFKSNFDGDVLVAGTGSMLPVEGFIECQNLQGLSCARGMGPVHCGFYDLSDHDMAYLREHPGMERLLTREEALKDWDAADDFKERFPEYIAVARRGWAFRNFGSGPRPLLKISARDREIPIVSPLTVESITAVPAVMDGILSRGGKVALVVIEGAGCDDIPGGSPCSAELDWYTYTGGDDFYQALMTGTELYRQSYPPGFRYYFEDTPDKPYPYSGPYRELPSTPWMSRGIKTIAAGSRGIITHVMSGADIALECFARALYNYGTMAVIRGDGGK